MEPAVQMNWLLPLRAGLRFHDELPASTRVVMRSPKQREGDFLLTRLGTLRRHEDLDDLDELFKRLRRSTAVGVQRESLEAAIHSHRPRILLDGAKVVGVIPPA